MRGASLSKWSNMAAVVIEQDLDPLFILAPRPGSSGEYLLKNMLIFHEVHVQDFGLFMSILHVKTPRFAIEI